MKRTLLPVLTLCFLLSILFLIPERPLHSNLNKKHKIPKKDRIDLAIQQEYQLTRDPGSNSVPVERLLAAKALRDKKLASRANLRVSGINWQERGPYNVGGRTRALMFDLNDPTYKKVWAAGVGGGLWYTNDISVASPVWTKVNDFFNNIAITAIVQNPLNPQEMYFGTGEGWFNADAIKGLGIWKSIDGGITWTQLNATSNFSFVNDLLIDKGGNIYASVRQGQASDAAGIQKSTDGGTTWSQVLVGSSARGTDLELASNGDIYASVGIFDNGGVYRSSYATNTTNTGNAGTWVNITPNTSGSIASPANFWHRIELACAPSDPSIVYALFQGYGSNYCTSVQQYNSTNNTWAVKTVPQFIDNGASAIFTRDQAWYGLTAAVDPNNSNSLYVGGIDALRSDDGGATWAQMTSWSLETGFTAAQNVHADQHAIVFAPGSSSRAVWGTDGGVDYTDNANIISGKPTYTNKNTGYNVTQLYSAALHPSSTNYFLTGAQDNGTQKFTNAGMNNTTEVSGGDGAFCHIDQDNPNIQITSYVYNNYFVSTNGGASFNNTRFFNNNGGFINPTDYDDAQNILYGGNSDGTFFRWNDPATAGSTTASVSVSAFSGKGITHVYVSPTTSNRVYFGLNNGSVIRVDDANTGTTKTGTVIKAAVGSVSVSCIAVDIANEDHMLVTYSNYGTTSIYESFNANQASPTWTAVEGNLPDMPVRWVVFDPRNSDWAIIATELGVWSTDDLNGSSTNWETTNSGLANVRVDMLQYRPSDRTLVAATHGRGLFTTVIPNVTTPDINFSSSAASASEQTTLSSGCRSYTDVTLNMTIANAPTGDASVALTIKPGNTATEGVDFDYTTNGDFNSISHAITFANGATANKAITIRVYNDTEVEAAESFTLEYSLSGTTNAKKGASYQQHTFTINDNDIAPVAGSTATIGTPDYYLGDNTGAPPFNSRLRFSKSTILYKASELSAQGLSAGYINSIAFYLQKYSSRPFLNLQIKARLTSLNYLIDGAVNVVSTSIVGSYSSYTTVNGWNTFNFNTPFYWNGSSNIVIEVCYDNGSTSATENSDVAFGYSDGGAPAQDNMYWQDNLSCSGSYSLVNSFGNGVKPMARFSIGTAVATALNSTKAEYLGPNNDVYFYSATGELMARIKNLSAHNFGCTQLTIDRSGNGATAFTNNVSANFLMNKTFRVVPTTNSSLGNYEITLYFTQAEVQAWEAATGSLWSNIQLIKVPSQISNYSPATPMPDGAGAAQVVVPIRGTFGTNYTLTYTFSNGFSGFGAGIPSITALPVRLLSFQGKLMDQSVALNWITTYEQNSKLFIVEKSTDGTNFYKIGSVNAKGTSITVNDYRFTDNGPSSINYYRLKMVDLDGTTTYSQIIKIQYEDAPQKVSVLTNPFESFIDLQFAKKAQVVSLQLLQLNGTIVEEKLFKVSAEKLSWSLSNSTLSKGVYLLRITADRQIFIKKLIKK
ncbi:T9SS type A sorting domain-containing protein [Flavisolibacter tropicus]|uniref:Calx-beta domain-containing protein n=1 Tax=Flavisolibacter tropicus TaxID=1492898 RepID=A0A172TR30_9BACT|nr:T9SS type A sorting domain-containing protein [Flavisolibacter tropicus]ANE49458.1 hypothetical protein SY85_02040 [Flavisolibacter tropicus]